MKASKVSLVTIERLQMNKCLDCRKDISLYAKRCRRCSKLGHGWPEGYRERQSIAQKKRFEWDTPKNKGKKMPEITGENNYLWKGEAVGIKNLHHWVKRHKGKPSLCEHCGTTIAKAYDWANIDHKYRRRLEDFIRLCRSCHRKYDYAFNNYSTKEGHYKKV